MIVPPDLVEACRAKRCVPFVGAGMSAQSGLPLWAEIINEMRSYLLEKAESRNDEEQWVVRNGPLEIADRFKMKLLPDQYHRFLRKWFDPIELAPSPAHCALATIPWPFLVTTNFDRLIELTFATHSGRMIDSPHSYESLVATHAAGRQFLLKLHGSVESPESVVLTAQDYARSATEDMHLGHFVQNYLLTFHHVLFLGFSISDPETRSHVLQSRVVTRGYATSDFVVLTRPTRADVEVWHGRGLQVITIDEHSELAGFLESLRTAIGEEKTDSRVVQHLTPDQPLIDHLSRRPELPKHIVELVIRLEKGGAIDPTRVVYSMPTDLDAFISHRPLAVVFGEAGSGKSTLAAMLAACAAGERHRVIHVEAAFLAARQVSLRHCVHQMREADNASTVGTVIVDGLDEVPPSVAYAILADLEEAWRTGTSCIATSRPLDLGAAKQFAMFSLEPLSEREFLTLAGTDQENNVALRSIFALAPRLHGRPLHALALREFLSSKNPETLQTEAAYALWSLDQHYARVGIESQTAADLEEVAMTIHDSGRSLRWTLSEWSEASACLVRGEARQQVLEGIAKLTGPEGLFFRDAEFLAPYHRTSFEAMVGRGLARSGLRPEVALKNRHLDHTSIMIACAIQSMSPVQAKATIAVVVGHAPLVAARTLLGAGQTDNIRALLLNTNFEVDLTAAIRHGRSILGVAALLELLEPLFRRDLRNPNLLAEAVSVIEQVAQVEASSSLGIRAKRLLDAFWAEHRQCELDLNWVEVSGGYYTCGTDSGRDRDEEPAHRVFLSPYSLLKYQVTNKQYGMFSEQHERERLSRDDCMPVVNVTWAEAQLFSRWISGDQGSRLPTEAEWETAARGGSTGRFPWGDDFDAKLANGGEQAPGMKLVGQYPPNGYGLHDMTGNVYEWCFDWYDEQYYSVLEKVDPRGPTAGRYKVMRGGSWGRSVHACSCTYRTRQVPETRDVLVGFRAARPEK